MPECASDAAGTVPPVFIPSLGRAGRTACTARVLSQSDVPFTIVVEPQEREQYERWLSGVDCSVEVLPESGRGVSYARNHILRTLAPRTGWFWVLDDDVRSFGAREDGQWGACSARAALRRQRLDEVAADPEVAQVGLEYEVFRAMRRGEARSNAKLGSYCTVCVALSAERIPADMRYCFRVREDFDFTLQLLSRGLKSCRLQNVSFNNGRMGLATGGMHAWYSNERCNVVETIGFLWKWGPTAAVRAVYKPPRRSGAGAGRPRLDAQVSWAEVNGSGPQSVSQATRSPTLPSPVEGGDGSLRVGAIVELNMGGDCDTGDGVLRGGWWPAEVRGADSFGGVRVHWLHLGEVGRQTDWCILLAGGDWRVCSSGHGEPVSVPEEGKAEQDKEGGQPVGWAARLQKLAEASGSDALRTAPEISENAALSLRVAEWVSLLKRAYEATHGSLVLRNTGTLSDAFKAVCGAFAECTGSGSSDPRWRSLVESLAKASAEAGVPHAALSVRRLWAKVVDFHNGGPRYNKKTLREISRGPAAKRVRT